MYPAQLQMGTYRVEIVTQVLYIKANTQDGAENKYDKYFLGTRCPDHTEQFLTECGCVEDTEDVYHLTNEMEEEH